MAEWEVWRQDDNGQRFLVQAYPDRVSALARLYWLDSGYRHKQLYEVTGDRRPTVCTNRDLYLRLVGLADERSDRALLDYLCALWSVSRPLASVERLDGDQFAALFVAAGWAAPVRPEPAWRVADLSTGPTYLGFADFTKVICTQISDLLAFAEEPPGPYAALGVEAPPRLDGGRATIGHWCNFDLPAFLEAAVAGAFGGWSASDGRRVCPAGTPGDAVTALEPISWGDAAAFLEYGQSYE